MRVSIIFMGISSKNLASLLVPIFASHWNEAWTIEINGEKGVFRRGKGGPNRGALTRLWIYEVLRMPRQDAYVDVCDPDFQNASVKFLKAAHLKLILAF